MKAKKRLRLNALFNDAARDLALIRDIIQQAPTIAKSHPWSISILFTQVECNIVAASRLVMKGVQS
jgi:hypothetical protein